MTDTAYTYGVALGRIHREMVRFWQRVGEGMRLGMTPHADLSPQQRELLQERRYRARIAREREAGLRYVHRYAMEVRRELGLKERQP